MHLHYKPRLRAGTSVSNWKATHDSKNRGLINKINIIIKNTFKWTYRRSIGNGGFTRPLVFANDRFIFHNGNYLFYTSIDGITWNMYSPNFIEQQITHIDFVYGKYIFSGGYKYTSTNLTNWTSQYWGTILFPGWGGWCTIANGIQLSNKYVLTFTRGNWPSGSRYSAYIASTTDGNTWTTNFIGYDLGPGWFADDKITYGNNILVASMRDTTGSNSPTPPPTYPKVFYRSDDSGATWSKITTLPVSDANLLFFSNNNSKFILVRDAVVSGSEVKIWTSIDLINWTLIKTFSSTEFANSVSSGISKQGLTMIGANNNKIAVSSDLINWDIQDSEIQFAQHIANGNSVWVAGSSWGDISTSQQGNILTRGLVLSVDAADNISYPPPRTGTIWYDISGNNNNGTLTSGTAGLPTYTNTNNGEINFSFKSYSSHPNTASLQFGTIFTICAWIKPTLLNSNPSNPSGRYTIFSTRLNGNSGAFTLEVGTNEAGTNRVGVSGPGTWVYRSQDNAITLNGWNHVTYVRDGSNQFMYVNGNLLTPASTVAFTITNNAANKTIGIGNLGTTEFFGAIAKVQVYNNALTDQEVKDNYYVHKNIYQP